MDVMRENVDVKTPATNFIALGRDSTHVYQRCEVQFRR